MKYRFSVVMIVVCLLIVGTFFYQDYLSPVNAAPPENVVPIEETNVDYVSSVKPVLEQRCVVCHACFDAPCQLKLGSIEGITRGAKGERVYDGERLIAANLTRLFEDAHSVSEWRDKDFFPVVKDVPETHEKNLEQSVLANIISLKQRNPLPKDKLLSEKFDLALNRQYECPTIDDFSSYKKDYPLWGMPYGLPALDKSEHELLLQWVGQGAPGSDKVELSQATRDDINQWERFFNKPENKAQLMSRYLFEHLFLVNLYFDEKPEQFFKLIRSATPPGQPIKGIFTRRPFDDPKVERVYYRIQPVKETIVHKAHMPMHMTEERMQRWSDWFLEKDYAVTALPSYKPKEASNPFITFSQIPVQSRYRFMLDESQNTIMQFIKGPVCRGQLALNVINDHFWVVFAEPDLNFLENDNGFMQKARENIALPAGEQSTTLPTSWIKYAAMERKYLNAKSRFIDENIKNKVPITLDLLWDGDGENDNLALTVFRHNDAATVVKGLVGDEPQTAWVLTYPLFERIHYLLVAGFDVYGNLGHQLNSRMYMDFLRMEGEFNFLSFLPKASQTQVRDKWYRGSVSEVEQFVYQANNTHVSTSIKYKTDAPLTELYQNLKRKVADVQSQRHDVNRGFSDAEVVDAFTEINSLQGEGLSLLPHSTIVRVVNAENDEHHFYTLLRHSAHTNISHLFGEDERRLPKEDTVTIASGFMTSHPNAFMQISVKDVASFAQAIASLKTEKHYGVLMDKFGIRRTDPRFWRFADSMHTYFKDTYPQEFGLLDFNRLENR